MRLVINCRNCFITVKGAYKSGNGEERRLDSVDRAVHRRGNKLQSDATVGERRWSIAMGLDRKRNNFF